MSGAGELITATIEAAKASGNESFKGALVCIPLGWRVCTHCFQTPCHGHPLPEGHYLGAVDQYTTAINACKENMSEELENSLAILLGACFRRREIGRAVLEV